jgi:hypothetical protein
MDHETFVSRLHRPWYVWKMAAANKNIRMLTSRATRMARSQAEIDQLVLERADTIRQGQGDPVAALARLVAAVDALPDGAFYRGKASERVTDLPEALARARKALNP